MTNNQIFINAKIHYHHFSIQFLDVIWKLATIYDFRLHCSISKEQSTKLEGITIFIRSSSRFRSKLIDKYSNAEVCLYDLWIVKLKTCIYIFILLDIDINIKEIATDSLYIKWQDIMDVLIAISNNECHFGFLFLIGAPRCCRVDC